jgi:DNA invertase Pin-like site-specific DNA recombinase
MTAAAIYARKSTAQDGLADDARSVTRQVESARRYAERKGWRVNEEHIYVDDGISGAEFERRRGLMRLLGALKPKPPFGVLIVSDVDRLGREQIETSYILKQLVVRGVRVFDYLRDQERVLDSPTDKLLLSVATYAAEIEREAARARTLDALKRKAKAGQVVGGTVFGYRNVEVRENGKRQHVMREIIPEEAAVVRRVFELRATGLGCKTIARTLNAERQVSPKPRRARARVWTSAGVRGVLMNPIYHGEVIWGRLRTRDNWGQRRLTRRSEDAWTYARRISTHRQPRSVAGCAAHPSGQTGDLREGRQGRAPARRHGVEVSAHELRDVRGLRRADRQQWPPHRPQGSGRSLSVCRASGARQSHVRQHPGHSDADCGQGGHCCDREGCHAPQCHQRGPRRGDRGTLPCACHDRRATQGAPGQPRCPRS